MNKRIIDVGRLLKAKRLRGKIIAQCPACHENGQDKTGAHLAVFDNGAFSCVVSPGDKSHNRRILELAGTDAPDLQDYRPPTPRTKPEPPRPLSIEDREQFARGVQRFAENPIQINALAKWRSWPEQFVQWLAGDSQLGLTDYNERPCLSLPVIAPAPDGLKFTGLHTLTNRTQREWRFTQGCKAYPVVWPPDLNTIRQAKTLVISEGGWDAFTAVLLSGHWQLERYGDTVFMGIRGAGAWRHVLDYQTLMSSIEKIIIIPDSDEPGRKWLEPGGFADELARQFHCHVQPVGLEEKDLNDELKAGKINPELFQEIFR